MTDRLDFSHKPTLHGDFVDLRPIRASDALIPVVKIHADLSSQMTCEAA